ncbi:histidine phosphatase family protein [Maricaulis sp.]|uniref:histidine phosphatase family protein n=1 Tax=Maricaulis sp. TaxID=1486257 RepID=UPI003A9088F4
MSRVLLARHGNTFGPGDKVVWVGAKEDLPLVPKGEEQAAALGNALREAQLTPERIITGPLQRTRRAAELVAVLSGFHGKIEIDERLREIDYGSWGGKSCDEIIAEFGAEAHRTWNDEHRRPEGVDWSPDEATLRANALAVMQDAAQSRRFALVITSNGVLRYMHGVLGGADHDAKVKTGHICAVDIAAGERLFWNEAPAAETLKTAFA